MRDFGGNGPSAKNDGFGGCGNVVKVTRLKEGLSCLFEWSKW